MSVVEHLVAQHFDMMMYQEMNVDHGFSVPMSIAFGPQRSMPSNSLSHSRSAVSILARRFGARSTPTLVISAC
jgi:hypothetical protein